MQNAYSRMEILLGSQAVEKLAEKKIAVFGLGGVGSYAVEALARCGIGSFTLVDYDTISITNINRELYALHSTVGLSKVQVGKKRIHDIDENILVHTYETFYNADTAQLFDLQMFDYIIDAIDTRQSKLLLIEKAKEAGVPIISCMATTDKLDHSKLMIGDISKASTSMNVKMFRDELKKRGIRKLKVIFSKEKPKKENSHHRTENKPSGQFRGSISFIPGIAGLMVAGEVVNDLLETPEKKSRIF